MVDCAVGSSPLTRGKQEINHEPHHPPRLIPAHAGKTRTRRSTQRTRTGSSPLTRGKRPRGRSGRGRWRLIPAHAGKTSISPRASTHRSAHPRSRGENRRGLDASLAAGGSSPLTRGKRLGGLVHGVDSGLIPAHAGKTDGAAGLVLAFGAHPRSRGENRPQRRPATRSRGSSPLTRGKPLVKGRALEETRLIPAHAGKTTRQQRPFLTGWAHPRSRGENTS